MSGNFLLTGQHPDAVSREQLHGAAGEEQQARRIAAALRFAFTILDAIPAPIITHFLKEAEGQNYRGFPLAGFLIFPNARSGAAEVRRGKRQAAAFT